MAGFLGELGAAVIDADKIIHELYTPGAEGFQQVVAIFGPGIIDAAGNIDRPKLANIIFADKVARAKLDAAVHPLVAQQIQTQLAELRRAHAPIVVVEVPLLIEAKLTSLVDEIWVTTAPREVVFRRLSRKCAMPYEAVLARIHAQLPVREQVQYATRIINTDTTVEHLKAKIHRLWKKIT